MKRLEMVLAIVFFLVGVMSAVNAYRLSTYMSETLPRDSAQEACQLATLQALRVWATGRGQIAAAEARRDTALAPAWEQLRRGERVSPDTAERIEHEFLVAQQVRDNVNEMLETAPIPTCQLKLMGS